ncbi:MAG: Gfo/Idh/MocA family oxidoreductase [Rhodobacteraceae bacterium]|nr:Gfo/Idh/MocA family oxidoreductase [Paracoccaceae bacterium]
MLTLPSLLADPRLRLVAAAAPRAESRAAFEARFGGRAYADVAALCADPEVEAIYVATPHQMHRDHALTALAAGRHVLVDKPLAVTMEDGAAMVQAARAAGRHLIVGPSHSFDAPVLQARDLLASGALGRVGMIHALNYTDFLYRPRRPEELVTDAGGGVIFSQAIHQIDVVRLLAGGMAESVYARTAAWDSARPTEGAYSALLSFAGGAFASLTYSGYAQFDSDEWMGWTGELGHPRDPADYGRARRALARVAGPEEEAALKSQRTFGAVPVPAPAPMAEHFGPVIVSTERGDLRLTPEGLWLYGHEERRFLPAPTGRAPRAPVVDALWSALREGQAPAQSGAWGLASLEVCHAILRSAATGEPVALSRQVAPGTP